MKLVKGLIISDEDENVTMSKDTFYEMDNNFNTTLKENKQLKEDKKKAIEYINVQKLDYRNDDRIIFIFKKLNEMLGDKENETN